MWTLIFFVNLNQFIICTHNAAASNTANASQTQSAKEALQSLIKCVLIFSVLSHA